MALNPNNLMDKKPLVITYVYNYMYILFVLTEIFSTLNYTKISTELLDI